jgi:hypothetical protein
MIIFTGIINFASLIAFVACLAGAIAGLIVFAPLFLGGWLLSLIVLVNGDRPRSEPAGEAASSPAPAASRVRRAAIGVGAPTPGAA